MASINHQDAFSSPFIQLSIFDKLADGVCISTDGIIEFMNSYLIEKFGNHTKSRFHDIFQTKERIDDDKSILQDKVTRYEWYSAKTLQTFDIINSPYINQDGGTSILSIFRDITEQKRLLKRLEGYYSRLKETNKELKSSNRKLSYANKQLEEISIKDELTGLYNQRHFWDILLMEFKRSVRYGAPLSCLMIDIDLFKSVNDIGSHSFGDFCLSEIGFMIRSQLRAIDMAARYGGEEFTVILPSTDYNGAKIISEKIRKKIEKKTFKKDELVMNLTVSIGVSSIPEDKAGRHNTFIEFADKALYAAKMQGRNRVCLYRDLHPKEKEGKLGQKRMKEIGLKLTHIMEGVKRDYIEAAKNLIQSIDYKDNYRQNHSIRVSRIVTRIAEYMNLSHEKTNCFTFAALLHDLGYLAISEALLLKKGKLTDEEFEIIKEHPVFSAEIVKPIRYLQEESYCILHHHEWYNGAGYPKGLKGEEIPLGARILSVADAFDSMQAERPYRTALKHDEILKEFQGLSSIQFDPHLVSVMLQILKKGHFF